jgi:hypothetical protein
MKQESLLIGGVIAGTLALIVGMAFLGAKPRKPIDDVLTACVRHDGLGMHIHPHLSIIIDGQQRAIPANIGITNTCMRPVHTHDETGTIHLEFPVEQDVRLSEFFRVWQQPFSRTEVLDRKVEEGDILKITVNGQETSELENLMMRDKEQIVIEVKKK